MNDGVAKSLLGMVGRVLAGAAVLLYGIWGGFALWYQLPFSRPVVTLAIGGWLLLSLIMGASIARRHTPAARALLGVYLLAAAGLAAWWGTLAPSSDRVWADDVARMTHGSAVGNLATLQNVRNFDWRTETDYTARWETRRYDLDRLVSVDLFLSYWGSPAIAHTLVSFGFDDGEQVVFSVEIRKERNEAFSTIGGFFKQFEMSVVAADERDIVRVRTSARGEQVFLYNIDMPVPAMRELFLSYVETANDLVRKPRYYNTVTANCTTIVYRMMLAIVPGLPADYRILLSGYLPDYLYKLGALDMRYSLEELKARAYIGERAARAGDTPDFSRAIRAIDPAFLRRPASVLFSLRQAVHSSRPAGPPKRSLAVRS